MSAKKIKRILLKKTFLIWIFLTSGGGCLSEHDHGQRQAMASGAGGGGSHCTMCVQISEGSTMPSDNMCPACGKDTTNIQHPNTFLTWLCLHFAPRLFIPNYLIKTEKNSIKQYFKLWTLHITDTIQRFLHIKNYIWYP